MGDTTRFWIGVISRAHTMRGVAGGFTQVCHGRRGPLARMAAGDGFIVYSPRTEMNGGDALQAFTALGRVGEGPVVQVDMGGGFTPFRREVRWCATAREVPLAALRAALSFTHDAGWGMLARRGHFEVSRDDAQRIASAMGVDRW